MKDQLSGQISDPTLQSNIIIAQEEQIRLLKQRVVDQEDEISALEKENAQLNEQLSGKINRLEWIEHVWNMISDLLFSLWTELQLD